MIQRQDRMLSLLLEMVSVLHYSSVIKRRPRLSLLRRKQLQHIINRHDSFEMHRLIQAHQPLSPALQQRLLAEARAALQREFGYALYKESIVSQLMIMETTATSIE